MILHLTELSSEPIHSQISRQVRSRILAGSLEPDADLPAPRTFARRHRVSALSVERAFRDLAAEGWLRRGTEDGFSVATVSEERKRDLAQQRLLETLREQEFSVKELELARDIQCRLLPPPRIEGDGWTLVARNEPARFVAGDFYDVVRHGDGTVDVVVADVSGKGIGPSLIMASVKAVLPFVTSGRSVREALALLNDRLRHDLGRREFVALAIARFEPTSGRLELANAGLPDPYLVGNDTVRAVEVPGERLPLGLRPDVDHRTHELRLAPGERLLLLSDGLPEADLDDGGPLGYEGFERLIRTAGEAPDPERWLDELLDSCRRETAAFQRDDWTALVLERSGGTA